MNPSTYAAFVAVAVLVVLIPGPDFAVVAKNTLVGGRGRGRATAVGVTASCVVQGAAAAAGLGTLVVRSQSLFEAMKWAGAAYLTYLAVQSWRSARRGIYPPVGTSARPGAGFRQGFLSNITNPKVLVFYLAVLPQFIGHRAPVWSLFVLASTHAVIGLLYLWTLVSVMHRATAWLARRRVRRTLDAVTGTALGAFGAALVVEH